MSEGLDTSSVQSTDSAPVSQAPAVSSPPVSQSESSYTPRTEKTFGQHEVDALIVRAKQDALRLAAERPEYAQQKAGVQPQQAPASDIRQIVADEVQRARDAWLAEQEQQVHTAEASRIANDFMSKLQTGKDKYQDFDSIVGEIPYAKFPVSVQLATMVDNTADVMYELSKEPYKLAQLEQLAQVSPELAVKQMQKMSAAIKTNEAATKMRTPNEPLQHLRPSTAGMDAGDWSVKAARNKYRG